MSNIEIFNNPKFGSVRTLEVNDEPWFVGKDIAEALGYSDTNKAVAMHVDDDDKKLNDKTSPSFGQRGATIINESGLYSLVLSSKLPEAKEFKHWITSDVLPSIRKHGMYATDDTIEQIMNNPEFGIKLLTALKDEREKRKEAEGTVAILSHVNKTYTMTEIAKELNMNSAQQLNKTLASMGIQFKTNGTWVFYSRFSSLGYEEIKQEVLDSGMVIYHRKITQRGREFILRTVREAA